MKGLTGDYVHDVDPAIFSFDTATSEITVNPLSNTLIEVFTDDLEANGYYCKLK